MNKEDFEVDPNGLQQVIIYLVKNLNELSDKFNSIQNQLADFRNTITDTNDTMDQKIEERIDLQNIRLRVRRVDEDDSEDGESSSRSGSTLIPNEYNYDEMKEEIENLKSQFFDLDCRVIGCESYSRKDCLILSGIPSNISHDALESEVLNILYYLGVTINDRNEVAAVHRLPQRRQSKYPPRVIVKFVNRKVVDKTMSLSAAGNWRNVRKQMGYGVRFFSSLCPKMDEALRNCKTLKDENIIHSYFIRNGYCMIVENEGDKPFKIVHPKVLQDQFLVS